MNEWVGHLCFRLGKLISAHADFQIDLNHQNQQITAKVRRNPKGQTARETENERETGLPGPEK